MITNNGFYSDLLRISKCQLGLDGISGIEKTLTALDCGLSAQGMDSAQLQVGLDYIKSN